MLTNDISLEHYQLDVKKLQAYGFEKRENSYICNRTLKVPSFRLQLEVTPNNRLKTQITDVDVSAVYMLHLNAATQGEFVGKIRQEYSEIVSDILANCFTGIVFTAQQSLNVIQFIKQKYDVELEYLWAKFPRNAIARCKDNNKWFAALLTVEKSKLGLPGQGIIEVLDLKMRPEEKDSLIDNQRYFPGYHMNKNHWFTICLDGRVKDEEIFSKIIASYKLAK
ncbi:MmcQ/YjbR family DNA-binding protein [Klebsiella sp. BIGb0407]|uniref:MmcQ/YjbR family DNA-binding protein n=1 Tax=Klebsiella sp. BIGb0407 TaxID=2940603 RepID=UPI002168B7C6|nr:MmcQ/YjbR family DNA-binding protein [Klebsiella sp. BIGb0407]MCS3429661.1 putative DNA-binding protein (MmcQ/YjbR family) [Klebsiella sp. BIGb0407]